MENLELWSKNWELPTENLHARFWSKSENDFDIGNLRLKKRTPVLSTGVLVGEIGKSQIKRNPNWLKSTSGNVTAEFNEKVKGRICDRGVTLQANSDGSYSLEAFLLKPVGQSGEKMGTPAVEDILKGSSDFSQGNFTRVEYQNKPTPMPMRTSESDDERLVNQIFGMARGNGGNSSIFDGLEAVPVDDRSDAEISAELFDLGLGRDSAAGDPDNEELANQLFAMGNGDQGTGDPEPSSAPEPQSEDDKIAEDLFNKVRK